MLTIVIEPVNNIGSSGASEESLEGLYTSGLDCQMQRRVAVEGGRGEVRPVTKELIHEILTVGQDGHGKRREALEIRFIDNTADICGGTDRIQNTCEGLSLLIQNGSVKGTGRKNQPYLYIS